MNNVFETIKAKVLEIKDESPDIKTFILDYGGNLNFLTGQFVEIGLPGIGEAPFTPSSSHYSTNPIEVTIMKTGYITDKIHKISKNSVLTIRGPYGKGYPLDEFKDKHVVLVGGGVGLAPLRSLLLTLIHDIDDYKKLTVCFGARTPEDLIYKDELKKWSKLDKINLLLSVDRVPKGKRWKGTVGVVTKLLTPLELDEDAIAVVCGPPVMMQFSTLTLIQKGMTPHQIFLSMERKMYCGIGLCRHCTIEDYFVCKDGPVFRYDQFENPEDIWA